MITKKQRGGDETPSGSPKDKERSFRYGVAPADGSVYLRRAKKEKKKASDRSPPLIQRHGKSRTRQLTHSAERDALAFGAINTAHVLLHAARSTATIPGKRPPR